jgi:hypothetical protein
VLAKMSGFTQPSQQLIDSFKDLVPGIADSEVIARLKVTSRLEHGGVPS